jgi:signal transduction histidine kinase/ligand-binding sensor domain-containing protein
LCEAATECGAPLRDNRRRKQLPSAQFGLDGAVVTAPLLHYIRAVRRVTASTPRAVIFPQTRISVWAAGFGGPLGYATVLAFRLQTCARWLLLAVISLIGATNRAAPPMAPDYLVSNWTTGDGLPENTVRAIVEARDGYLWLGTANGLARFDGVRFTRFDSVNTPALLSADIVGMQEDPQGGLWISTRRGMFRYAHGRFEVMPRPQDGPMVSLGHLTLSPEGELWMSAGEGLAHWDGARLDFFPLPPGPAGVVDFCGAPGGGLWLAAQNGLWRYRNGTASLVEVSPAPELLATARDGTLWGLVGQCRLFALRQGVWSMAADLGNEPCNSLYCAPGGEVWMGAANRNRAFRLREGQLTDVNGRHGLEGNRAICFAEDHGGNLWLGMNGAGLYRLRERRVQLFRREDGLKNLSLASVCQAADGTILVNVMGQTVHRFAGGRFEPVEVSAVDGGFEYPTALMPARDGGVWAGTFHGPLTRIHDGRVCERVGASAGTRALFTDRNGDLWRGTRVAGVEHFSGTNVTRYTTNEGLSFNNVYCLAQDQQGAMWVGTEAGLNRIAGNTITRFGRAEGLGHHFISALCLDSRGTLWAGTLGGGLSAWRQGRFVTLTTRHGLPDDTVQQLLEDDCGHLWLGTRAGLMRVALDDLHAFLAGQARVITGTLIGRNEGLPRPDSWTEYQPAGIKTRDGQLWFCTSSGVVRIDPQHFAAPARPPMVHIEEVRVDGQLVDTTTDGRVSPAIVPPGSQRIELRYTGLTPASPELVRFHYRLRGYDRDWVEARRSRFADYTHLSPGRYEFQVQAANNDGVWNENSATLPLIVKPTFWQGRWFKTLVIVLFLGVGPAIYRWRVRRLERRQAAQEAFSGKLIESQEQERKRIAAELHDSLGQNLLVVRNLALMNSRAHAANKSIAGQFDEISECAGQALAEVRSISHALRPVELDRLGLTRAIQAIVQRLAEFSDITFEAAVDNIDGLLPPNEEINLYRIVQECLNNILKHSRARRASIECNRNARGLQLAISDDGQGFTPGPSGPPGAHPSGLGLISIIERAHTLGGTAEIFSRPGHGTRIQIVVPIRRVALQELATDPDTGARPSRELAHRGSPHPEIEV